MNPVERLLARLFVRPGDTVFDIGAHEGESAALYLARGAGSVLSFEPRAAPRGRFPAAIRDDPRLTLYPFGLSDRVGDGPIPDEAAALEDVLAMMACKASVRAGEPLAETEAIGLFARALEVERASNCPHGRPTTLRIPWGELRRRFGRSS